MATRLLAQSGYTLPCLFSAALLPLVGAGAATAQDSLNG